MWAGRGPSGILTHNYRQRAPRIPVRLAGRVQLYSPFGRRVAGFGPAFGAAALRLAVGLGADLAQDLVLGFAPSFSAGFADARSVGGARSANLGTGFDAAPGFAAPDLAPEPEPEPELKPVLARRTGLPRGISSSEVPRFGPRLVPDLAAGLATRGPLAPAPLVRGAGATASSGSSRWPNWSRRTRPLTSVTSPGVRSPSRNGP